MSRFFKITLVAGLAASLAMTATSAFGLNNQASFIPPAEPESHSVPLCAITPRAEHKAPLAQPLELGQLDAAVEAVRMHLILSGDLDREHAYTCQSLAAQTFDYDLMLAVIRFQTRHGLEPDGVVHPQTQRVMELEAQRSRPQHAGLLGP